MISVIIPMYNSQNTIERALDSIKNQSAIELISEVIIVDDGSTDKSREAVNKYIRRHPELNLILLEKNNGGVSSARNAGLRHSNSEWVALLDSDDEWLSNKIEVQYKILKSNPQIDFLGANATDEKMRIFFKKIDNLYNANIKDLCLKCFPPTPTAIFRKNIVNELGYFDESQHYGEDMNYFNKICLSYNYYHLNSKLVELNDGESRVTHKGLSSNLKGMHKGNIKNIKELVKMGAISRGFYTFLRVFYYLKHLRRLFILKKSRRLK